MRTETTGRRSAVGRLLVSYFCAAVANGLPWPLLLVLVWDQYGDGPHGAWAVGAAGAARMAPYVLLSWAVGSLGDHVARDRLLRATLVLRVVFLSAAALALSGGQVALAVVMSALAVTAGTPAYPAIGAALPQLAGPDRVRATELLVTIEVSAWVVGPALGGLLLAPATRSWTLAAAVLLAVAAWLLSIGIAMPGPVDRAPDAVGGMLRAVLGCRPAAGALGLAGLINLVVTTTGVVLLPLTRDGWQQDDAGFGVATACLGFGALGAPLLCRLVVATRARGLLVLGAALAVVALSPAPWVALPLLAVAGAGGVAVETLVTRTIQDAVPDRYRAGALGVADAVMVSACLVGSLAAPGLARLAGARPSLLLVAALCLLPLAAAAAAGVRRPVRPPATTLTTLESSPVEEPVAA